MIKSISSSHLYSYVQNVEVAVFRHRGENLGTGVDCVSEASTAPNTNLTPQAATNLTPNATTLPPQSVSISNSAALLWLKSAWPTIKAGWTGRVRLDPLTGSSFHVNLPAGGVKVRTKPFALDLHDFWTPGSYFPYPLLLISQEIALYSMAIVTAILSMAFGLTIPSTTAIIGGMTSSGSLVPNPYWEANDFIVLERAGVKRVVAPASALVQLGKMVEKANRQIELVGVDSIGDIVNVILKPLLIPPSAPPSPRAAAGSSDDNNHGNQQHGQVRKEAESVVQSDDDEDDYKFDALGSISF